MAAEEVETLPEGWLARKSRSTGMIYYLNRHTKKSQWEKPVRPAPLQGEESDDEPYYEEQIRAMHILVKHAGSRTPSSWREEIITRTKQEAYTIIEDLRRQIVRREAKFEDIARQFSDCSSAKRDGDLGYFKWSQMQRPFADVAFSLTVGQVSHAVETDSGIHIIFRID